MTTNNIQFQENMFATSENVVRVMEVVVVQSPLPSIVQSLQPPVITSNKLHVEGKERLLQDLKKLGDLYKHLVKHSTLRFLLKKLPKDVAIELLRWMRGRLPQIFLILLRVQKFKSYLELQTSKLDNLGSPGKLRQRSETSLFTVQPISTIFNVKYGRE
ncbi:hypothetical protein CR513_27031, partial [Mucuna pruriens]